MVSISNVSYYIFMDANTSKSTQLPKSIWSQYHSSVPLHPTRSHITGALFFARHPNIFLVMILQLPSSIKIRSQSMGAYFYFIIFSSAQAFIQQKLNGSATPNSPVLD